MFDVSRRICLPNCHLRTPISCRKCCSRWSPDAGRGHRHYLPQPDRRVAGIGKAGLAADRPVTTNTLFRLGSLSKAFATMAALSSCRRIGDSSAAEYSPIPIDDDTCRFSIPETDKSQLYIVIGLAGVDNEAVSFHRNEVAGVLP